MIFTKQAASRLKFSLTLLVTLMAASASAPATAGRWLVVEDFKSGLQNSRLVDTNSRYVRIDRRRGELVMKPGRFASFHDGLRFDFGTGKIARTVKGLRVEYSVRRCAGIDSGNAIIQIEAIGMGNMVSPRGHIRNIYGLADIGFSAVGGSVYNYFPGRSNGRLEAQHTQAMDRSIRQAARNVLEIRWTNSSYSVSGNRAGVTTHKLPQKTKSAMTARLARAASIDLKTFFSDTVSASCEIRVSRVSGYFP